MTTLGKRIESLEKQQGSTEPGVCTVFVEADEDADQKQEEGVAAFVAKHGHQPSRVLVISFVEPPVAEERRSQHEVASEQVPRSC